MGSGLIQVDSECAYRSRGISYWEKNDGRAKNDVAVFSSAHVIYLRIILKTFFTINLVDILLSIRLPE